MVELLSQLFAAVLGLGASQHAAEQRGVEALGRIEAALDLAHGHLVLGRRAEQAESAGHFAELVVRIRSATTAGNTRSHVRLTACSSSSSSVHRGIIATAAAAAATAATTVAAAATAHRRAVHRTDRDSNVVAVHVGLGERRLAIVTARVRATQLGLVLLVLLVLHHLMLVSSAHGHVGVHIMMWMRSVEISVGVWCLKCIRLVSGEVGVKELMLLLLLLGLMGLLLLMLLLRMHVMHVMKSCVVRVEEVMLLLL